MHACMGLCGALWMPCRGCVCTRLPACLCAGQLPGKVRKVLMLDNAMRELASQLMHEHSMLFFGRGHNYATALEAALKVRPPRAK